MASKRWDMYGKITHGGTLQQQHKALCVGGDFLKLFSRKNQELRVTLVLRRLFTSICLMVETSAASFELEGVLFVLVCQIVLQITNIQSQKRGKAMLCYISKGILLYLPVITEGCSILRKKSTSCSQVKISVWVLHRVRVATYGCLLLMQNPLLNLYMLNLLTAERYNLPLFESQLGKHKPQAALLADEETKDSVENIM
ncbi:hypothetical protein AALP_AA2G165300 [Arabis alpina]|uniref:Uncharacterized protein n=1 Tax=Arabis alpina TaxID=50452 RepID=A0A087HHX8_ARAAL|nr:hypothetical protein AALP_AA2G165300 [Arabis alpina]